MLLKFYKLFNGLCFPILSLIFLYRLFRKKEDAGRFKERVGFASAQRPKGKIIWIHATSVGETMAVLPLLETIVKDKTFKGHILLTTTTIGSIKLLGTRKLPNKVIHQLCPLESWPIIVKFLKFWKPDLALFVEAEFWPCIFAETAKHCKILSINTRISEAALKSWQIALPLLKATLDKVYRFFPQSDYDAQILRELGITNYKCLGSLKYARSSLKFDKNELAMLKKKFNHRLLLLFVSTHPGEEEIAANVYLTLKAKYKSLLAILIPRHIYRVPEIVTMLKEKGLSSVLHSKPEKATPSTEFYVVDTMGEVNLFSSIAPVTVMGGSFVNVGGHNLIEPASCGSVVVCGPNMQNFKSIREDFESNKAAIFVHDGTECAKEVGKLLSSKKLLNMYKANAARLLKSKANVIQKIMKEIRDVI